MNKFNSSRNKKKIIDAFNFFNEFDLLKLRLNYLNDIVDYFLICECNHTYSANPKPYYLDQILNDIPENIRKKIIRIKYEIDGRYYYNDPWRLESEHRDFIGKNLTSFSLDDIIMISDLDEIPNKEYIKKVLSIWDKDSLYVGEFDVFLYNFITCASSVYSWHGTILSSVKKCIELGSNTLHKKRKDDEYGYKVLKNGGWHFTYFGNAEKIKLKVESYSHQEYNDEKYINSEYLIDCIKNKKCFYDENQVLQTYNFNNYPEELKKIILNIFSKEYYTDFSLEQYNRSLYLDLLKKSVTDALYDQELLKEEYFDAVNVTKDCISNDKRSQSMIGLRRLNNIQECFESIVKENIPGHLIETGVWRGGSTIFMAGLIKSYNENRKVFVADSFEGLPYPNEQKYPDDKNDSHWMCSYMNISIEEVCNNFKAYDLLDNNVVFLKGWFENTLPTVRNETFSLIRLDGDMYGSTWDALENLYPSLSVGGYLIVDDWTLPGAHKAVVDYRTKHNITDSIIEINQYAVFWRKTK